MFPFFKILSSLLGNTSVVNVYLRLGFPFDLSSATLGVGVLGLTKDPDKKRNRTALGHPVSEIASGLFDSLEINALLIVPFFFELGIVE